MREWFREIDTDRPTDSERREFVQQRFFTDTQFMQVVECRRLEALEGDRKAGTDFD